MTERVGCVVGTGFVVLDVLVVDGVEASRSLGGSCGNVLAVLAALGHRAIPILKLGNDSEGRAIVSEFRHLGAVTEWIKLTPWHGTPVLLQYTNTQVGDHRYARSDAGPKEQKRAFSPLASSEVAAVKGAIDDCALFYCDRLSDGILDAMAMARRGGAIVMFEPNEQLPMSMMSAAAKLAHIIKAADDRVARSVLQEMSEQRSIIVSTAGSAGIDVGSSEGLFHFDATFAPLVIDSSGAGDMVTAAIIDSILLSRAPLYDSVLSGVDAGRRLAAANCRHAGARGLLRDLGSAAARGLLLG